MEEEIGIFGKIDRDDFITKIKQCYDRYGMPPLKYKDKSGITLGSDEILELALKLGLIRKH